MLTIKQTIERQIKNGEYELISHAFLYSTKTGSVTVREGDVYIYRRDTRWENYIFVSDDNTRRNFCAGRPGETHNGLVWFEERNDEAAKWVFIQYELDVIARLEASAVYHKTNIEHIKADEVRAV